MFRDAILPNETGLLIPTENVPLLALAMIRLGENLSLREDFGAKGRQLAELVYNLDLIVTEHLNLYETTLAQ